MLLKSTLKAYLGPGSAILALTIGAKSFALLREILIARALGTGPSADALAIGQCLPNFLSNALLGPLSSSLLPAIARIWSTQGVPATQGVLHTATGLSTILTAIAAVILVVFPETLIHSVAPDTTSATMVEAKIVQSICALNVVVSATSATWTIASFSVGSYLIPTVRSCISPILSILLIAVYRTDVSAGQIAGAILAGNLVETGILGIHIRSLGFTLIPRCFDFGIHARTVLQQYIPILIGATILNSATLAETHFASQLGPGTLAILGYSTRVVNAISGLITAGLGNLLLASLSHAAGRGNLIAVASILRRTAMIAGTITGSVALIICLFSKTITAILYTSSTLSLVDRTTIALSQSIFAWQMPFYVVSVILARGISSLRGNKLLTIGSLQTTCVSMLLNGAFSRAIGVYMFPSTSVCTYALATVTNALFLRHLFKKANLESLK